MSLSKKLDGIHSRIRVWKMRHTVASNLHGYCSVCKSYDEVLDELEVVIAQVGSDNQSGEK